MASFLSSELKSMLFLRVLKSRTNLFRYLMYRQWPVYFPFSEYTDVWGGGQGGTPFPVPSPFPPTSLPLHPHFPPPSPPLPSPYQIFPSPWWNFVLTQELKRSYIYVSEELRMIHHRLSCRIFMYNYSVGKEPDYLQINVFSRHYLY